MQTSFQYSYSQIWRNLGILIAFYVFFLTTYLVATELNSSSSSTAEVLLFRRGKQIPQKTTAIASKNDQQQGALATGTSPDEKSKQTDSSGTAGKDIFTWRNVTFDIHIKDEPRRLLDNVSGWVKPGTLTALMGTSGAGKTTLLDVLAQRVSIGVITGDMLVNGKPLDSSFQRKTGTFLTSSSDMAANYTVGYVQQQDVHLETSTVREALRFSAALRQPKSISVEEKYDHVEEVIEVGVLPLFSNSSRLKKNVPRCSTWKTFLRP